MIGCPATLSDQKCRAGNIRAAIFAQPPDALRELRGIIGMSFARQMVGFAGLPHRRELMGVKQLVQIHASGSVMVRLKGKASLPFYGVTMQALLPES